MKTLREDRVKAAKREGHIVIYSSLEGVLASFLSAYKAAHHEDHAHISFYSAHPMAVYEKIKAEIKAGIQTADMVILPHYLVLQMQHEGLLRPYSSSETKTYPKEFYSPEGWASVTVEPMGIVYNPNKVNENDLPTNLEELTDPKWKGKVAMQALTEYPEGMLGFYFILALKPHLGEDRWRSFLSNLAKNVNPVVFDCLALISRSIVRGEYHFGIPLTLRRVALVDAAEGKVEFLPLDDLPHMASFKTVGLMKNGSNPNTAEQFFDFAISKEFQEHIGQKVLGELPARPGVKTSFWVTTPNVTPTYYFPKMSDVQNSQRHISEIKHLGLK